MGTILLELVICFVLFCVFAVVMMGHQELVQEWTANLRAGHRPTIWAFTVVLFAALAGLRLFALWFTQTVTANDTDGQLRVRTQRIYAILWLLMLSVQKMNRASGTHGLGSWLNLDTVFLLLMLTGKLRLPQRRKAADTPHTKKR